MPDHTVQWHLSLVLENGGATVHLAPAGELDLATAPCLDGALRAAQRDAADVTLDLRGLGFMDCSSLAVLASANDRARRCGGRLLVLRGGVPVIDRLFAITDMDRLLEPALPSAVA